MRHVGGFSEITTTPRLLQHSLNGSGVDETPQTSRDYMRGTEFNYHPASPLDGCKNRNRSGPAVSAQTLATGT